MKEKKMNQDILLTESISPIYQKFFAKFNEIDSIKIEDWKVVHILGYFCKRYHNYYNMDYTFRFNDTAPSKAYESYQIKKLSQMLSSDPQILKNYIDWIFDTKIIARKKRLTAIGYLTTVDLVNEYKFLFLFKKQLGPIDRSTELSLKTLETIKSFELSLKTYGDLAFIKKIIDIGGNVDDKYKKLFDILSIDGFDIESLSKVK
jgi:hypothetical protein